MKAAIGALLLTIACWPARAQTLSLDDAVEQALARNPAIVAAEARTRVAHAREAEARASRFPRVEISESATRGNNPVFVFGSLLEQGEFAPRHFDPDFLNAPDAMTNYRAALTARVTIFDRFRTTTAVRQSRNGVDRTEIELVEVRQSLRAETVARFFGVALAEERLRLATEVARMAEADAKATRDRFDQGLLVESDALAADVHVADMKKRVIAAEGELAIAQAGLATLLQRPLREPLAIDGTMPRLSVESLPLDDAIARAVANRAPVKLAASATSDARLRLAVERASLLPRVDAFGTFGASGGTFGDRNSDHTAGVIVTLDVFDRGRPARVAAARAESDAIIASETIARDAVTMESIAAWHRVRVANEIASVAVAAVEHSQSAARIVRDRYEQGLTTITEHLRAQTALVSARFDLLAARYEIVVASAELLRATGDLNDVESFR
ncbi:MAG TPA: TolC family protein [Thermoanaerobaculia bacterium]